MLLKDLRKRPPIAKVLASPWLSKVSAERAQKVDVAVLEKLAHNTRQTELRKALLMEVASRENLAQLTELNQLFESLDKSNTGVLDAKDVHEALRQKGWNAEDIQKLLDCFLSPDGKVPYEEFMVSLMGSMANEEGALLDRIFREADREHRGELDVKDLEELLKRENVYKVLGKRDAAKLLRAMDTNGDGFVSLEEFKAVMHGLPADTAKATNPSGNTSSRPPLCSLLMTKKFGQKQGYMGYTLGANVEYLSSTYNQWMPATVTAADAAQGVQLSVKPGYWFIGTELFDKVRRQPQGGMVSSLQK
jgi:Ca2+-binding EF-hand superfamily protein